MKKFFIPIVILVVYVTSLYLLFSYDWHIGLGVLMFGWAMNMERNYKKTLDI